MSSNDGTSSEGIYAAPESETHTSGTDDLMSAYVGPKNAAYYERRFDGFESGGGSITWHWPAFFFTSGWLLYRKMWLWALLYWIVFPIVNVVLAAIISVAVDDAAGGLFYWGFYFVIALILIPMYANRLYYKHAKSKVDKINSTTMSDSQKLQEAARKGGTSLIAYLAVFVIIFVIGILAAIAIPAYQDYTIRAQVSEGLSLSAPAKVAVVEYYDDNEVMPANNAEAGLDAPGSYGGMYASSVEVANGQIIITYSGDSANGNLYDKRLVLSPEDSGGYIEWECFSPDIANKWLPAACR